MVKKYEKEFKTLKSYYTQRYDSMDDVAKIPEEELETTSEFATGGRQLVVIDDKCQDIDALKSASQVEAESRIQASYETALIEAEARIRRELRQDIWDELRSDFEQRLALDEERLSRTNARLENIRESEAQLMKQASIFATETAQDSIKAANKRAEEAIILANSRAEACEKQLERYLSLFQKAEEVQGGRISTATQNLEKLQLVLADTLDSVKNTHKRVSETARLADTNEDESRLTIVVADKDAKILDLQNKLQSMQIKEERLQNLLNIAENQKDESCISLREQLIVQREKVVRSEDQINSLKKELYRSEAEVERQQQMVKRAFAQAETMTAQMLKLQDRTSERIASGVKENTTEVADIQGGGIAEMGKKYQEEIRKLLTKLEQLEKGKDFEIRAMHRQIEECKTEVSSLSAKHAEKEEKLKSNICALSEQLETKEQYLRAAQEFLEEAQEKHVGFVLSIGQKEKLAKNILIERIKSQSIALFHMRKELSKLKSATENAKLQGQTNFKKIGSQITEIKLGIISDLSIRDAEDKSKLLDDMKRDFEERESDLQANYELWQEQREKEWSRWMESQLKSQREQIESEFEVQLFEMKRERDESIRALQDEKAAQAAADAEATRAVEEMLVSSSSSDEANSDADFEDAIGFDQDESRIVSSPPSVSSNKVASIFPLTPLQTTSNLDKLGGSEKKQKQLSEHVNDPTEHVDKPVNNAQNMGFLAAAHNRIVKIQAQRWRQENRELHAKINSLLDEQRQLEAEEEDMQLALEGAEKLNRELHGCKVSEAFHRVAGILSYSLQEKRRALMCLAFRQLDRHRLAETLRIRNNEADWGTILPSSANSTPLANVCQSCEVRKQKLAELMFSISDTTFDLQLKLRSLKSEATSALLQDAKSESRSDSTRIKSIGDVVTN